MQDVVRVETLCIEIDINAFHPYIDYRHRLRLEFWNNSLSVYSFEKIESKYVSVK